MSRDFKRPTLDGRRAGSNWGIFLWAFTTFIPSLFSQDNNQTGFGDSDLFSLDTNSNVSGVYNPDNSGFADSGLFGLDTRDGNHSNSDNNQTGFGDSGVLFSLDTTDQEGASPDHTGFADMNGTFTLDTTDGNSSNSNQDVFDVNGSEVMVSVSGTVNYDGVIPGPAIVWALEANGTKADEVILPDGNGSYFLSVQKGKGYDFKVFVDGSGDGYPQGYEVWKHHGDWNSSTNSFNLTQVDGNLSGIDFNLWDLDNDNDGFVNWYEHVAQTDLGDAGSTPGLAFGLVAHWEFDELNGTTLGDSSGNDINGTLVGFDENGWSPGQKGGSLYFDGVNDHVSFEGTNKLDDIRPFSFSGWVKLDLNGSGYVIAKRSAGPGYWRLNVGQQIGWLVRQGTTATPSITYDYRPAEFSWEHIVLTWTGFFGNQHMNLYHNGQLVSNVTKQGGGGELLSDATNSFSIGNRPQNNSSFFKGWMDDFRLWNRVVTAKEAELIFNLSPEQNASVSGTVSYSGDVPGPVVVWAFDENNSKVAQQVLSEGPGQYSLSLPAGHYYDIKAFRDGNGNGNLDVGIGEPYAHWGAWENGSFVKLPVYGDRNDTDFAITWENDQDQDGFTLWQETQAGTSDQNASSHPQPQQLTPLSDANFQTAVNSWFSDEVNATAKYGHISDWNTSAVTDMTEAFKQRAAFNEDISGWDTSSVTSMGSMFWGASAFNRSIGNWDVSSVQDAKAMFLQAGSFNQDISNWDTASLTDTGNMFYAALSFNQDIGTWNTSAFTNMGQMFRGATAFNQNLKNWDTSKVGSFFHTFDGAHLFDQNISDWNVSSAYAMTNMFGNPPSLSDQNKGLIHTSFSTNSNWSYDWSSFVEGGDSAGGGGDHNTTEPYDPGVDHNATYPQDPTGDDNSTAPYDPGGGDHNTTEPYDPGGDHNATYPGTDNNDTDPSGIAVFNFTIGNLIELTGSTDSKAGGTFAVTELYEPADPQKTFLQLEEAVFDGHLQEWNVDFEGRVLPLKSTYSAYHLLEEYLMQNQLYPAGYISFVDHNTSNPNYPGNEHNGTTTDPGGEGDHNSTDPHYPDGDHNSTGSNTDTNQPHPRSISVFNFKGSSLADLTGLLDIKQGGNFAMTLHDDPLDPEVISFELEEVEFDQELQEWNFAEEGRVFPLKSEFSDLVIFDNYLLQNQLDPVGHIEDFDSEYPEDDHNGTEPWNAPVFEFKISTLADLTGLKDIKMGGAFTLVEHGNPAQSEEPIFELEEVVFDEDLQEWYFPEVGRVLEFKPEFSNIVLVYNYLIQNQIVPVGNLYGDDSEYPEDDHNGTEPWDAPVFEFKISTLADLTGHKDIKMGGAFALVEYWDSAQSEKPEFELEEVAFDEELQEWYFLEEGRLFPITAEFSDFINLENYMLQNQIYPAAYIYLEDHFPDTDHIPVFDFRVADLVNLTGLEDIKEGGTFALTGHWEPARPDNQFIQLEEVVFDAELQEWSFEEEGRVFPLSAQFSEFIKVENFLGENNFHPLGYIFIEEDDSSTEYPHHDDESDKPYESHAHPPIVQTRKSEILENGLVRFSGRILFDGGSPIMEAGIFVEDEYSGKIERLLLDPKKLDQRDFTITTNQLAPGTKYHYFTFAQNDGGESRGVGLTLRTPASPDEKPLIAGAKPLEGGWLESEWFGTFKTFENGWTYHDPLGWVFISGEQKDGLWMWRETNGWLWTDSQTWPFLWQHDLANWLYLFPSRSGEPPIFYDYGYSKYRE